MTEVSITMNSKSEQKIFQKVTAASNIALPTTSLQESVKDLDTFSLGSWYTQTKHVNKNTEWTVLVLKVRHTHTHILFHKNQMV